MADTFVTVQEIAQLLKLNQQTVRNTIDRGDLRAVRFGRRVRVRQADLDAFLASGETRPVAALPDNLDRSELAARLDRAKEALEADDDAALLSALQALFAPVPQIADGD